MTDELPLAYANATALADNAATDGLVDLWFDDGTHASARGSYPSALTLFGTVTGANPFSLGAGGIAAHLPGICATGLGGPAQRQVALRMLSRARACTAPNGLAGTARSLSGRIGPGAGITTWSAT